MTWKKSPIALSHELHLLPMKFGNIKLYFTQLYTYLTNEFSLGRTKVWDFLLEIIILYTF